MNEFTLAARQELAATSVSAGSAIVDPPKKPQPQSEPLQRKLGDLSRDELLREALFDPASSAAEGEDALDDDRLRQEVRWRRTAALREPAFAALARLLSKVSSNTLESLSKGDISAEQLIEKANSFVSGQGGVKILKLPDRVEDHERRLNNLESSTE
jgi:hypothetical protein